MKNNYFKGLSLVVLMMCVLTSFAQTKTQKEQLTSRYDKQVINQLQSQFSAQARAEKQAALEAARTNNWPVIVEKNGTYAELQRIAPDGSPIYYTTFNVDAARSTRTDHLNIGGSLGLSLDGQNMTAHVWDGGLARPSHQEYDGPGGNNRFSIGDGSSTLNFHAAHVTGTIIASGVQPAAKGMAPRAQAIGFDWNSDLSEATTAAANGMLVSNHSYGFRSDLVPDQYFGAYIADSRDWDNLLFNAPFYLMVVAAGNDGNTNYNGSPLAGQSAYDKLTGHATSKNNMVVANAQDASIDASGNLISVTINSSSSEGPTDDYRIKPDITGNGTGVYSTYETSDTAYNSITGTSMASPNVAGSLLLLQQHANNLNGSFMRAATLKGLALHTADDAGPTGPDAVYGWGLMNAKRAAETLTANGNESQISELTLASGQTYQITVDSDGVNDLFASISWTDRPGTATSATNSTTARLVNDLDLRVSQGATTYTPWRLTGVTTNGKGDNSVDPFERVEVANASGTYTITVTHKGSLTGGSQNYSLIITGLSSTPVVCNATTPANVNVDAFADTTATISWDPVPGASYTLRYRPTGGSWTTVAVNGSSANLTGLSPETSYEAQVRSQCPDNTTSSYSGSVNFTTTEIQLNYCDSASTNTNDEFISRVQLNTIDNTSGAQFYSNFTNVSTSLTQGQSYTITVTPTWTGTVYAEGYSVWIDYNKDGDFSDAGEQVWSQAATTATPVSGSFTIPSGTVQGNTRMRVTMQYNAVPSACGSFTYGEVEDYTVNLQGEGPDTVAPVITLNGASTINLNVGDTYTEQGATATDNVDGDITADIVIGGDTVDTNSAGTYVVTYNVSDAAGNAASEVTRTVIVTVPADTTPPVITLNGASTINLNVGDTYTEQGATATDNVDGDITADVVIGGDTVDTNSAGTYVVTYNVSDAAGNAANQVTRTVNVTNPTSGCTGSVSAPYSEGFENTLGAWSQSSADDIDWTVDASGTPSSNTGPSSASQGSYYIYVEASGNGTGYPNKRAIINSPCFDLSGMTSPTFDFDYHMYGATDMGTIALEASTDNGNSWTSVWSESGNKGNQWNSASIDMSAYSGGTVQLRFNRLTGSTWQADIAIDNVSLSEPAPPTCDDGIQNGDETGVDCGGSCAPCSSGSEVIHQGFFETGWDGWADGGSDAFRYSGSFSYEGSYSIRIRDNSGTASSMTLSNVDVSSYDSVEVEFYFYPNSMENGEDFWLRFYDGSSWNTVAAYAAGSSFTNGSFYTATVTVSANDYNFASNSGFRFQCDASGNNDQIYIDQVTITGISNGGTSTNAITSLGGYTITSSDGNNGIEEDMLVFPNPVKGDFLNVKLFDNLVDSTYVIKNMLGQTVSQGSILNDKVNVSALRAGMYFIEVNDGEEIMTKRFIRQ
ncbi:MAG: immunoglobulin-like domain-containing protein [bacterium]